jgi:hypothetical protein
MSFTFTLESADLLVDVIDLVFLFADKHIEVKTTEEKFVLKLEALPFVRQSTLVEQLSQFAEVAVLVGVKNDFLFEFIIL